MRKDVMQAEIIEAMKNKDEVKKNILRVALGEIQAFESRQNTNMTDAQIDKMLRKIFEGNKETLAQLNADDARVAVLTKENEILSAMLPQQMTEDEICDFITDPANEELLVQVLTTTNSGKAIGAVMNAIKAAGLSVNAKDVGPIIEALRTEALDITDKMKSE